MGLLETQYRTCLSLKTMSGFPENASENGKPGARIKSSSEKRAEKLAAQISLYITNLAQASLLDDNDGGVDPRHAHVFLAIRNKIFGFLRKKHFHSKKKYVIKNRFYAQKTFARQKIMGKQNRENA